MIKQSKFGLVSRKSANPYLSNNMLPIITSNMYSVVDVINVNEYLERGIQVALPRKVNFVSNNKNVWYSYSMEEFRQEYLSEKINFSEKNLPNKVLIDCANGCNPALHELILEAKEIYNNEIKIMSGNVGSIDGFIGLYETRCDYIRIGIGGSTACNTTRNTGVGQEDLGELIASCAKYKNKNRLLGHKTHLVADGISSYVKMCQNKYEYLDNGYAAINKLLYLGADLVMVGSLFAQSQESSGLKVNRNGKVYVVHQGMSTKEAQLRYSEGVTKHSEGNSSELEVKWSLNEWLYGSETNPDYLPGYINTLQSAMAYCGCQIIDTYIGSGIHK